MSSTVKCVRHPDLAGVRYCQKTNRWFCLQCGAACMSPKAHCKFRTACIIWALEHDRSGSLADPGEASTPREASDG